MRRPKQNHLPKYDSKLNHGGVLRRKRKGRKFRPLSTRQSLHVVLKANRTRLKHRSLRSLRGFRLTQGLLARYAKRFFIRIEHASVQHDHIHLLIRGSKRSLLQAFFRVLAGQIAQEFMKANLVTDTPGGGPRSAIVRNPFWLYRPFSRIVLGVRAWKIVRDYIQLNEKEVLGVIRYRKERLRGLKPNERLLLWSG